MTFNANRAAILRKWSVWRVLTFTTLGLLKSEKDRERETRQARLMISSVLLDLTINKYLSEYGPHVMTGEWCSSEWHTAAIRAVLLCPPTSLSSLSSETLSRVALLQSPLHTVARSLSVIAKYVNVAASLPPRGPGVVMLKAQKKGGRNKMRSSQLVKQKTVGCWGTSNCWTPFQTWYRELRDANKSWFLSLVSLLETLMTATKRKSAACMVLAQR